MTVMVTLKQSLRMLAEGFEQAGRVLPTVRCVCVRSSRALPQHVLEGLVPVLTGPNVSWTQEYASDASVLYSIWLGDRAKLAEFNDLAARAIRAVDAIQSSLNHKPLLKGQSPSVAWLDTLDMCARLHPDHPMVTWDVTVHSVWGIDKPEPFVVCHTQITDPEWLIDYAADHGPEDAACKVGMLRSDVFTASKAVIDLYLRDIEGLERDGRKIGREALDSSGPEEETTSTNVVTASRRASAVSARAGWVNPATLIGPISLAKFARLLNLSERQVRRQIEKGEFWQENGPSPKRSYFHVRAWKANANLLAEFMKDDAKKGDHRTARPRGA